MSINKEDMHQDDDPFYYNNNQVMVDESSRFPLLFNDVNSSFIYNNYNLSSPNPQTLQTTAAGILFDPNTSYMTSFTDCLHGSSSDYNTLSKAFDMSCSRSSSDIVSQFDESFKKDHGGVGGDQQLPSTPNSSISSSSNEANVVASTNDQDLDFSNVKRKKDKELIISKEFQDGDEDKSTKGYVCIGVYLFIVLVD